MLSIEERHQIRDLICREVIPAIGCTEPIAVALCVAKATELLGCTPTRIEARLSANIIKNAMGVGIPGTDMVGLPVAIALGTLVGRSAYGLEVLRDVTPQAVNLATEFIEQGRITISLKENITEKLYIEISCTAPGAEATAIIAGGHTDFVYTALNGVASLDKRTADSATAEDHSTLLTMRKVYDYATQSPIGELEFILESAKLNKAAARDTLFAHILAATSGACDARMGGAMVAVMSNSGSGNQGISATMPVLVYGEEIHADREHLIRALILSHLTVIYIKQKLGRLSALCGCVVAATGSSCGITYLMGGDYRRVSYAVKNMVANLTGMICDGAKPSCALKVTSGVSTAIYAAMMAMADTTVTSLEGIVDNDVDITIDNLTRIGLNAMREADREILSIMLNKS